MAEGEENQDEEEEHQEEAEENQEEDEEVATTAQSDLPRGTKSDQLQAPVPALKTAGKTLAAIVPLSPSSPPSWKWINP